MAAEEPDTAFVRFFCEHMRCSPVTEVTRLGWRYLDEGVA
jgi:hypothetical protein